MSDTALRWPGKGNRTGMLACGWAEQGCATDVLQCHQDRELYSWRLKWGPGPWEGGEVLGWAEPLEPDRALKALAVPKYHIFIYERLVKSNVSSIDSVHVANAKERFFFFFPLADV